MKSCVLLNVVMEMDLHVVSTGSVKPSKLCAGRAGWVGLIKRNFCRFSEEIVLDLCKQFLDHILILLCGTQSFSMKMIRFSLFEEVKRRNTRLNPEDCGSFPHYCSCRSLDFYHPRFEKVKDGTV